MINEIIQREWEWFQSVRNIGGRASCQDDHETFYLQRKAQFQGFPQELQESYLHDLIEAKAQGRNPVMEKYAYMMESTDPEEFVIIKEQIPIVDEQKRQLIDMICEIEVSMREEVNQQYPYFTANARNVHTSEDTQDDISFETYLRGELSTYSPHTLYLYGKMVLEAAQNNQNIVKDIMERTSELYGYQSLEDANLQCQKRYKML